MFEERKDQIISFRVTPTEKAKFHKYCRKYRKNPSTLLRRYLIKISLRGEK